ncbi:hypothetical protein NECID01_0174 [Nematocida sp. AWRm77]|nr:hypothetical protein NECID01_0174 [Nematocida sp. AWRm77]
MIIATKLVLCFALMFVFLPVLIQSANSSFGSSDIRIKVRCSDGNAMQIDNFPCKVSKHIDKLAAAQTKDGLENSYSPIEIPLDMFATLNEYFGFKELCGIRNLEDPTVELSMLIYNAFENYLKAAEFFDLEEKYLNIFMENLVKNHLCDENYIQIVFKCPPNTTPLERSLLWRMFLTFLNHIGFQAKVHTDDDLKKSFLVIERIQVASGMPYRSAIPEDIAYVVLAHRILEIRDEPRPMRTTLLKWFLLHLSYHSVNINYRVAIGKTPDKITDMVNTVTWLSKPVSCTHQKTMVVSKLRLSIRDFDCNGSLVELENLFAKAPNVSILHIHFAFSSKNNKTVLTKLSLLKDLTSITFTGFPLHSDCVDNLFQNVPKIQSAVFSSNNMKKSTVKHIAMCTSLKRLKIAENHPFDSKMVKKLLKALPNIVVLELNCQVLSKKIAQYFHHCQMLTKLTITSSEGQKNTFMMKLLVYIPTIQKLSIKVAVLDSKIAEALRKCDNLSYLFIDGGIEPGFIEALLKNQYCNCLRHIVMKESLLNLNISRQDNNEITQARENEIVFDIV